MWSGLKVIKLRLETSLKSQASDSPFQPIRCLRFETGFHSQFYNHGTCSALWCYFKDCMKTNNVPRNNTYKETVNACVQETVTEPYSAIWLVNVEITAKYICSGGGWSLTGNRVGNHILKSTSLHFCNR
jgi:hypothetical protein